jgi:hypothetical protein
MAQTLWANKYRNFQTPQKPARPKPHLVRNSTVPTGGRLSTEIMIRILFFRSVYITSTEKLKIKSLHIIVNRLATLFILEFLGSFLSQKVTYHN